MSQREPRASRLPAGISTQLAKLNECKEYVLKRIDEGRLKPLVGKVINLNEFKEAYAYMLSNQQIGKIVVRTQNPK